MGLVREDKMRKIAVGVVGVGGRMGVMTLKVILEDPLANIAGGVVRTGTVSYTHLTLPTILLV